MVERFRVWWCETFHLGGRKPPIINIGRTGYECGICFRFHGHQAL